MSYHIIPRSFQRLPRHHHDGVGDDLPIVPPTASGSDAERGKPIITAEAFQGHVCITGSIRHQDSFDVYMRRKGQPAFRRLAARHRAFPFVDDSPPARADAPETREYLVMGIPADEATGQPSDIVTVVVGLTSDH